MKGEGHLRAADGVVFREIERCTYLGEGKGLNIRGAIESE